MTDPTQALAELDLLIEQAIEDGPLGEEFEALLNKRDELHIKVLLGEQAAEREWNNPARVKLREQVAALDAKIMTTKDPAKVGPLAAERGLLAAKLADAETAAPFVGKSDDSLATTLADARFEAEKLSFAFPNLQAELVTRFGGGEAGLAAAQQTEAYRRAEAELTEAQGRVFAIESEVHRRRDMAAYARVRDQEIDRLTKERLDDAKAEAIANAVGAKREPWEIEKLKATDWTPAQVAEIRADIAKEYDATIEAGQRAFYEPGDK